MTFQLGCGQAPHCDFIPPAWEVCKKLWEAVSDLRLLIVESLAKRYGAGKSLVLKMRSEFHDGANAVREAQASYGIKVFGPRRAGLALGNV